MSNHARRMVQHRLHLESLESRCLLATFVVTNLTDGPVSMPGELPGSLRQALFDANQRAGADVIAFEGVNGSLQLTAGELFVQDELKIQGPGIRNLTIDANSASRVFRIDDADSATSLSVEIRGLKLTGGAADRGAGIWSVESLALIGSEITGNTATELGGGILAETGAAGATIIQHSRVSDNSAANGGGLGVATLGGATLTIERTSVTGNRAGLGAGIFSSAELGGTTTIADCTVSDNSATSDGGGIFAITGVTFYGFPNSTTIERCIISGNHSASSGGGIHELTGEAYFNSTVIRDSTISFNAAYNGGGIFSQNFAAMIVGSTVSGNVADRDGGGVHFLVGSAINTTIVFNTADADDDGQGRGAGVHGSGPFFSNVDSTIVAGNTLGDGTEEDTAGFVSAQFSLIGQDPLLGPLRDNGGRTPTHALRPGSPAIDSGNPGFVPPPDHDQRGFPFQRVVDGRVDIGAFESQTQPIDFDSNGVVDCVDVDALVAEFVAGSHSIAFDLTGDALLDRNDLNVWLTLAGLTNLPSANPHLPGDANLDGFVDAEDFVIWNQHKFTLTAAWCSGDFNADGFTDAQDFIIWNENKFQSALTVENTGDPLRDGLSTWQPPILLAQSLAKTPLYLDQRLSALRRANMIDEYASLGHPPDPGEAAVEPTGTAIQPELSDVFCWALY